MNKEDLNLIFHEMDAGAEYWRNFFSKYKICSKDFVVVMASKREDFNYYTLKYLYAFKEEKKADRIYVLHTDEMSSEYIEENATVNLIDICCKKRDIENLCSLVNVFQFSEQVIFNTYDGISSCDGSALVGTNGMTVAELVAVSFLGIGSVVDKLEIKCGEEERKYEGQEEISNFKRIDWMEVDAVVKIGKRYVPTNENREEMICERIHSLIEKGAITVKDKIVLFGLSSSSIFIKAMLSGYNIVAIIDNDKRKIGKKVDGIPICTPEEILGYYDPDVKVIVASRSYHAMCEQLYQYGYEVNRQVFIVYFLYYYYDVLPETISHYKEEVVEGNKIYSKLTECDSEKDILLCPYPGTGDIYLIGIYLKQYIEMKQLKKYVLVVCSQGCRKVAEMFGFFAEVISEDGIYKLLAFSRAIGLENARVHVLNDNFGNGNLISRIRGYRGIDFNTMFAKCIFRLDRLTKPKLIKQDDAGGLFEQYNLQRGKTVLLSPYANTMNLLSTEFWELLAEKLIDAGYSVCTNVASDNEQAVNGTQGIFIPYGKVVDFLNQAGYFIGLRSGLCDIISCSGAKLCIMYQKNIMFGGGTLFDYFSLEKMGLRSSGLKELEYDLEDMENVMSEILDEMI